MTSPSVVKDQTAASDNPVTTSDHEKWTRDEGMQLLLKEAIGEPGAESEDSSEKLAGALAQIEELRGAIFMCRYCKRIGTDREHWQEFEWPGGEGLQAQFTHTICPDCYATIVKPEVDMMYTALRGNRSGRNRKNGSRNGWTVEKVGVGS